MKKTDVHEMLLGKHKLEYVYPTVTHPFDPDKAAFAIRMDGVTYLFLEDDNDGYRSSLGHIFVSSEEHNYWHSGGGTFVNRDVKVTHKTEGMYKGVVTDIYEFRDVLTENVGLEVGTDNIDDYYPSFVCNYNAQAWGKNDRFY